jgi:PAS domain-containing protein
MPTTGNRFVDSNERQRMEEGNRQLLAEMETLLGNALVGIVHLRQRRVVSCNRRLEEIFGYLFRRIDRRIVGSAFYPSRECLREDR